MEATTSRRIGPIGTIVRVAEGLVLLSLAFVDFPPWLIGGLQVREVVVGLVVFPTVMVAVGLVAGRISERPLRFHGTAGTVANAIAIVVLFAIPYTTGAAALFYGASELVAAWRALPGCEATILSNLLLRRDDQIGCPTLSPIDALEARHAGNAARAPKEPQTPSRSRSRAA